MLALHGFTLTGAQFAPLAGYVDRSILAPDLPGHGESASTPAVVPDAIAALADLLTDIDQPAPVLGYSMGGRLALSLALDRPELVKRVVVVSAGPGIEDEYARAMRVAEDEELAVRIRRDGVRRLLDEWLSAPVTSTESVDEPERRADRALREENSAAGLADALRGFGQGSYPYFGDRLGELGMPLLAVSGGADARYTGQAAALAAAVPDGQSAVIPGVGHNVILEAPEELGRLVDEFLAVGR